MYEEHFSANYFDYMRSYIYKIEFGKTTIQVSVKNFRIFGGYPDYDNETFFESCTLIYKGVISSERKISEYASLERKSFKNKYRITDGPFEQQDETIFYLFEFHSIDEELNAYINWRIIASEVTVER